jgi:hypothetical protein
MVWRMVRWILGCICSSPSWDVPHLWAISLMGSRTTPGTANLKHHDSVIAFLRRGFLPADGRARDIPA